MNFQSYMIGGFLGQDPTVRYTQSGMAVANFSVAVNRKVKDKPDEPFFMSVVAWDKTAEMVMAHFKKGKAIFCEGYLKEDKWDDKETGQKRSKIVMVANRVHFVGKKEDGGAKAEEHQQPEEGLPF